MLRKTDRVIYLDERNEPRAIVWDQRNTIPVALPGRDPWAVMRGQWLALTPCAAASGYIYGASGALMILAIGACVVSMTALWGTRR